MGGKHKVANRTKNNARPASSGRSAELLATSSNQFALFAANKDSVFEPCMKLSDDIDITLDPNVQVILKKICKKDSVTKIKGLQELAELISSSEADNIKPILPVWTKFFNGLVTDMDSRVRDAAHSTHREIISKAKRNIAPYLKQLMPAWFTSQYDTYPPAASTASLALKEAFPKNKFQEAIVFCQEDILSYISDNLLVQTSQTLSNMKHVSEEEAEGRYERVLISSLQGYCLYLEQVTAEHIENQTAINNSIVSNAKYWKLSKHKVPYVRAAWFKVLIIICQKAQFLLEGKASQITGTVFGALDEKDPIVVPCVWEALLLTMSTIKEWWKHINVEKLFYPKLWKILKLGGEGNTSVVYPSLLPLISHLTPSIEESASQFYNTFFENFRVGLNKKSSNAPKSESVAIITAFIECFQYAILKRQDDIYFCKNLIKAHLISTIKWCLIEEQAGYKNIFNQIASLAQHWHRNAHSEAFKIYLQFFFESLGDLFDELLFDLKETGEVDIASISNKQVEFLQSLRHAGKLKKNAKVKFVNMDTPQHAETAQEHLSSIVEADTNYYEILNLLVNRVCLDFVRYIEEKQCKLLIEHLYSLAADFNSEQFFEKLMERMRSKNEDYKIIHIYENLLYKWMKSDLSTKHVVDLSFLLFKYLGPEDKEIILNSVSDISDDNCLSWFISKALAHPYNKEDTVRRWLQNDRVSNFIVSIIEKEIDDTCTSELSVLLKLALTENVDDELYVRDSVVSQIIDKLINTLRNYQCYATTIDNCASLSAYLSAIIYTNKLLMTYGDGLLTALFSLSCIPNINNDIISPETLYEINTAWQDALSLLTKHLSKEASTAIASKLAEAVEAAYLKYELNEKHVDHLVSIVVKYLSSIHESAPMSLTEYMKLMLERPSMKPWQLNVYNLCRMSDYIKGYLSSPYEEIELSSKASLELEATRTFVWMYLRISAFSAELSEDNYPDDEDEEETETNNILKVLDNRALLITQILHDMALAKTYLDTFKNTKYFDTILTFYVLTEIKIKSMIVSFDNDVKDEIKRTLKEKSLAVGWFWTKATYFLYTDIIPQSILDTYEEFVKDAVDDNKLGVIHLTQVFSKHLNYDYVQNTFDPVGDIIVLNSLIHCDEIDVQIAEVFSKIEKIRSENVPRFLFDTSNINWKQAQEILEVVRLSTSLMKWKFSNLSQRHWDFCVICLVSWASNCLKNRASYDKYQIQALMCAVANLFVETDNQIKSLRQQNMRSNYVDEWQDVLVESVHGDLAQVWLYLAEQLETKGDTLPYLPFIQEFFGLIANINYEFIFKINDTSLPKWTKFMKRSCSLLLNKQPSLQLWGYKMLHVHIPGLVKVDTEAVNMNTPHKKGLIFEQFKERLVETHEIVNTMLLDFKLGEDSCHVEPSTDSFTYTFAYLLLWDVLLSLCQQASSELRYQYAEWLRNEDLLKNFLNNTFRLMPAEILHYSEGKCKLFMDIFQKKPDIHITDSCGHEHVENLVCWLYHLSLSQLPALVRQWWTNLDSRVAQIVDKITTVYISQSLCTQELNDVLTYQNSFKNMVIKVMPTAREVIAVYTVDEAQVELVITLPSNYPLGGLDVQCNKQIAGASHKQWLLQFKKCVLHQNGRIWDGLSLWNNNLDKKFDGVEECYICFAVLHPGTCQLPKLSCQTCKKKFHSACLYKWFRTSYKSSCPICRNLF